MSPVQRLLDRLALIPTSHSVRAAATHFNTNYRLYLLALERGYRQAAIETAYRHGLHHSRKFHVKLTDAEKRLAAARSALARYSDLDFVSVLIFSRALMDNAVGLSAVFLQGQSHQPSYRSFAKHKKFFLELTEGNGRFEDYAAHIRTSTDWFDVLKLVRDDFVVHPLDAFMQLGLVGDRGKPDLGAFFIPSSGGDGLPAAGITLIGLSDSINGFLDWFGSYAIRALEPGLGTAS